MNSLRYFLPFLIAFGIASCVATNNNRNLISKNAETPVIIVPAGETVLEITNDFEGMAWMMGEILDFRLYSDGIIEFDDYPTEPSNSGILDANAVKVRKQYNVDEKTVSDLRSIVTSNNFIGLKDKYEKLSPSCDAISDRTVIAGQKKIKIPQWCGRQEPPEFPNELFELFRKIREIKKEKLGRSLPTP